jgi:hypothetical protein
MRYPTDSTAAASKRGQKYFYCVKIDIDPFPILLTSIQGGWLLQSDSLQYIEWPVLLTEPNISESNTPMKLTVGNKILPDYGLYLSQIDSALPKLGNAALTITKVTDTANGWEDTIIFDGIVLTTAWTDEHFVISTGQFYQLNDTPGTDMATTMCLWPEQGALGCDYVGSGTCNYSLDTCRKLVYSPTQIVGTGPNGVDTRGENYRTFPVNPAYSRFDIKILAGGSSFEYRYNQQTYVGPVTMTGNWQTLINDTYGNIEIIFSDTLGTYVAGDVFRFQVSNENNFAQPGLYAPIPGDVFEIRQVKIGISKVKIPIRKDDTIFAKPKLDPGIRIDQEGNIGHGNPNIPTGLEESDM